LTGKGLPEGAGRNAPCERATRRAHTARESSALKNHRRIAIFHKSALFRFDRRR
jgi:hypothetical protein